MLRGLTASFGGDTKDVLEPPMIMKPGLSTLS